MSTRSAAAALALVALATQTACWEQLDGGQWFPQMKRQPAVQAYEYTDLPGHPQPFSPPEGTLPVGASGGPVGLDQEQLDRIDLTNPVEADLASLENGKVQYETFCAPCHGKTGLADGPVSKVFLGVLPLVGVVKARSDGHIFSTISHGRRRMPAYSRIQPDDRWDIVNYVRYLDEKGGRP